ncbi:putative hemagglutinin [Pseudomonas sp. BAY1663]|uniref:hypothetical protein n=1 Tax=Pseudomonas sp. BAY1663 TaxID=1439940 RepID=UPI00042E0C43|nr:hypothetical protein [Pseudomonas sp. BAY1663]EXF44647.1 putative hemagglutinin [Pseudomonas sp. BAY1663]
MIRHVGTGTFGLSAANVMAAGGSLSSNGVLGINASSWVNSSVLQAGTLNLNIGTFTQTASGQLLASQALVGSGGSWTNHGLLASDGTLSLTLSGGYGGAGRVTSLGDLTLRAGTLNNYGTLGSAEQLKLHAPTLLNENGLIFSGGDMALRVNEFTNKYADVYSLGSIDLARDASGNQASRVDNLSATLEAVGDFSLRSAIINNARDVLIIGNTGKYSAVVTELACRGPYNPSGDCDLGSNGRRVGVWQVTERDRLDVVDSSAASNLMAGGDLFMVGQQLLNHSSLISAGGNLEATFATLENKGVKPGEVETLRIFVSGRKPSYYYYADAASSFNLKHSPSPQLETLEQDLNHFIGLMEREYLEGRQINEISSAGEAYSAIIQAGGDVTIQASQTLENSAIRPRYSYVAAVIASTAARRARPSQPTSASPHNSHPTCSSFKSTP